MNVFLVDQNDLSVSSEQYSGHAFLEIGAAS